MQHRFTGLFFAIMFVFSIIICGVGPAAAKGPPPLPLHGIEGYGGIAITYSAYLTNPAADGKLFGKPSIGVGTVFTGNGDFLGFSTITETIGNRLELGYGVDRLYLSGLQSDIKDATGIRIRDDVIYLHNINARLAVVKEGGFGLPWIPAITLGVHYKYNNDINKINDDLSGTLKGIGIQDNEGIDYTLYGSKMLKFLPRPVLVNAGLRSTKAAHIGFLGFTNDRDILFEGSMVTFLTQRFALGAEYRQKANSYKSIPGLVGKGNDWWSFVFAYVFNEHLTVSGGYFSLGQVLNHKTDNAYGLKTKWEF